MSDYAPDPGPADASDFRKVLALQFLQNHRDLISPFLFDQNSLLKLRDARVRQGWVRAEKGKAVG